MSLLKSAKAALRRVRAPISERALRPAEAVLPLLSIDLGCGEKKHPGFIGVDQRAVPGVDHVLDFACDPLPFGDRTVGQVFSSHCLEHLRDPERLLREVTRTAADGAALELWAPYSWHGDAHFFEHVSPWNERQFLHMGTWQADYWAQRMGARWRLHELVFGIEPAVVRDLRQNGIHPSFGLRYLKDVAHELGVVASIDRSPAPAPATPPLVWWATSRDPAARQRLPDERQARLLRLRGLRATALQRNG